MINKLSGTTISAIWEIDNVKVSLWHKREVSDCYMKSKILEYKQILMIKSYMVDNTALCGLFKYFGGMSFVEVGFNAFRNDFIEMFRYFSKRYTELWFDSDKQIYSKEVGIGYVFETMLNNDEIQIKYNFMHILHGVSDRRLLNDTLEDEFSKFWIAKISETINNGESLGEITPRIGFIRTTKYATRVDCKVLKGYLKTFANEFTENRERISQRQMWNVIFDSKSDQHRAGTGDMTFVKILKGVVSEEFELQYEKFPAENYKELNIEKDTWIIYKKHGPSLYFNKVDFSVIKSPSLRLEVKWYLKHRFAFKKNIKDRFITEIAPALNLLIKENLNIKYMADIDEFDVKKLHNNLERMIYEDNGIKIGTTRVMNTFSRLKVFNEYLMSEHRDKNIKGPRPHINYFKSYIFVNSKKYIQNTLIVPNEVIVKLEPHIKEVNPSYQLIYKIFSETGLRTKEVLFLEENCIEDARYEGLKQLKYLTHKTLSARKKKGVPSYHKIMITEGLADEIKSFTKGTEKLRRECKLPYIFLVKRQGCKPSMLNLNYYISMINKLIEMYDIRSSEGELWNFTNRQYRKTLAVTLIENGATIEELAYWLGHLNRSTAALYYAEVRAKKLEGMNTEFFKKQFDLLIDNEQLEEFNEEERRLLYMDFRLDQRRVEFGYCMKKLADGGCNNRSSMYNCINCKMLCTGKKYLPYWQEFLKERQIIVDELISIYNKNKIIDYENFKEYQKEVQILNGYKNIVNKIEESEVK
jgi:integrase